jgi:hypothetical protein
MIVGHARWLRTGNKKAVEAEPAFDWQEANEKPWLFRPGLKNWRQGLSHLSVLQPEPSDVHLAFEI